MSFQAFEEMEILADIDYFGKQEFGDALIRYNMSAQILSVRIDCKDYFQAEKSKIRFTNLKQ